MLEKIIKVVESFHNPPSSGKLVLHILCRKGKTSLSAVIVDKHHDAVCVHDSKHKLTIHYATALQPSLRPIVLRHIDHTLPESCYQTQIKMKVTLTTVQMYSPVILMTVAIIMKTQYGVDHKQHTIAQQMMLYSFQI